MKKQWYLGRLKNRLNNVYLYDFEWECNWYWGGGYIGNNNLHHTHFDSCFLNVPDSRGHSLGNFFDPWTKLPEYLKEGDVIRLKNGATVWEPLSTFLNNPQYNENEWWRIKDLFTQFYSLRKAAGVFQYGGHCTDEGRTKLETNKILANRINLQIGNVIIPEIRKALDKRR